MQVKEKKQKPEVVAHVGLDWSDQHHDISYCREGQPWQVERRQVGAKPEELEEFFGGLLRDHPEGKIAVYMEGNRHSVRYFLMVYERVLLYLIPTTSSKSFRASFRPSGASSDETDADLMLELGYKHRERFRYWEPESAEMRLLGTLTEDRRELVERQKARVQQLRPALKRYFPQALEVLGDLSKPLAWRLLKRWPRLEQMQRARAETLEKFLKKQGCRKVQQRAKEMQEVLQGAMPMTKDSATIEGMVMRVLALLESLEVLSKQISIYDAKIEELFKSQPEAEIFESFPGAGACLAPRLMALFGEDRKRFEKAEEVSVWTGIAPTRIQSGNSERIEFRRGCPKFLRQTLHEFAACSRNFSPWAKAHYESQRSIGKNHQCAVRSLAFKWVRILYRCWKDQTVYSESRHLQDMRRRRSQVLAFLPTEEETRVNKNSARG